MNTLQPQPRRQHTNTEDPAVDSTRRALARLSGPVLLGGIFLVVAEQHPNQELLVLVTHIALIVAAVIYGFTTHPRWTKVGFAGGVVGASAVLVASLVRLVDQFSVLNIFKLFTEPIIAGVIDSLAAGMVFLLASLLVHNRGAYGDSQKNQHENQKSEQRSYEEEG